MREVPLQIIPPGVHDERARGFRKMLEEGANALDFAKLLVRRYHDVDASVLPSLVVEHSAQIFLTDGVKERFVRDVLANIWELKARTGTVDGCRFGLSLLGMSVRWTQWFDEVPKAEPGTYKATIFVTEPVVEGDVHIFSRGTQRAALQMVAGTKRHSQEGRIGFGLSRRTDLFAHGYTRTVSTRRIGGHRTSEVRLGGTLSIAGFNRQARRIRLGRATRQTPFTERLAIGGIARTSRLMRIA